MAYSPTNWKNGDIVTADKLNKLENGVAACGVLIVNDTEGVLDKTYAEIVSAGFAVAKVEQDGFVLLVPLTEYGEDSGDYVVVFNNAGYITDSENGYPVAPAIGGGDNPIGNVS